MGWHCSHGCQDKEKHHDAGGSGRFSEELRCHVTAWWHRKVLNTVEPYGPRRIHMNTYTCQWGRTMTGAIPPLLSGESAGHLEISPWRGHLDSSNSFTMFQVECISPPTHMTWEWLFNAGHTWLHYAPCCWEAWSECWSLSWNSFGSSTRKVSFAKLSR